MAGKTKPLLIFDFDGTLANTLAMGIEIFNDIAADYGLKTVTVEEVRELRKLNTRALLDHVGVSRLMAVKLGAHIRKLLHERMDQVEMFIGAREAILELNREGFQLGILSSNSVGNIRVFLERFGVLDCFGFIEAGVSLFGKPQRILNVMRKVRIDPMNVIYVGDETRDMEAARLSKVSGIAVCWGVNERDAMVTEDPAFCIDSPSELLRCARKVEAAI